MQRLNLVREYLEGHSVAGLARKYGISERIAWKWIGRWKENPDPDSLRDRSRAPLTSPSRIDSAMAELLLQARADHPTWGPRKLLARLARLHPEITGWPAPSTAGELLKRHGLVLPRKPKRHASPSCRLEPPAGVNDLWAMDYKGWWVLQDGTQCGPLTITDLRSRFLIRALALEENTEVHTRAALMGAFREYGMPARIRSDNGPPFASTGPFGLTRLGVWLIQLGIHHERITPGRPQENGSHERMHLTLDREVASDPAANRAAQQKKIDEFREEFNFVRPHEALGQIPPGEIYVASRRAFPEHLAGPEYGREMLVRRVDEGGQVRLAGKRVSVGRVLSGMALGLRQAEEEWRWEVWLYNHHLGWIDERSMRVEEKEWSSPPGPPAVEMPS